MTFLFVDGNIAEAHQQWIDSGLGFERRHTLLPPCLFQSIDLTLQRVMVDCPDVVVIGHRLGHCQWDGCDVAWAINCIKGPDYSAYIIANGVTEQDFVSVKLIVDGYVNRDPKRLADIVGRLTSW